VYASPVLFVRLPGVPSRRESSLRSSNSATGATLDTGGWLALTRQGLSPCKVHQASLGALTILHNADNDFLVAETIERMKIISFDDQYPHVDTMLEFALNRYFYHNMPLDRCVNCMHGDTIANITRTLASNYDGENRYDDAIRIIDNLINKRGQEISDYKQADLYDIYAYALWRRGDKASAIATLKTSLAKWQNTINGRYLKRDLDRYTREFSKLQ
jgi:tetratricopeptide (TPR) repeat protein